MEGWEDKYKTAKGAYIPIFVIILVVTVALVICYVLVGKRHTQNEKRIDELKK